MAHPFQSALTKAKKRRSTAAPALPPLGSYDPSILLQYGQNKRTGQNAQDTYDLAKTQAEDDLAIGGKRIDQSLQNNLTDIGTSRQSLTEDHATALANLGHNFGVLAHQQAQRDNQANVESAGILGQQAQIRAANQAREQQPIDTSFQRGIAASTTAEQRTKQDAGNRKADLALTLARNFGSGKGGNPLGSQTLNLTQTLNDALGGNLDLSGLAYQQAAGNGFRFPRRRKRNVIV